MDVFSIYNLVYFQDEFNKAVIGSVVLTDYNNRTYVISDISWNDSPHSTFDRDGTKISYVEYYNSVSNYLVNTSINNELLYLQEYVLHSQVSLHS